MEEIRFYTSASTGNIWRSVLPRRACMWTCRLHGPQNKPLFSSLAVERKKLFSQWDAAVRGSTWSGFCHTTEYVMVGVSYQSRRFFIFSFSTPSLVIYHNSGNFQPIPFLFPFLSGSLPFRLPHQPGETGFIQCSIYTHLLLQWRL